MIEKIGGSGQSANTYLVLAERAAVIDPGLDDSLLSELERFVRPEEVKFVINTHCHFDHIAANSLFPKAEVLMHDADAGQVEAGESRVVLNRRFGGSFERRVDRRLFDGDQIGLGDLFLKVIHTPGHTAGSISLLLGEHLFTGDLAFRNGFGRTDLPTGSAEQMQSSLKRLLTFDWERGHPGHGPDFSRREFESLLPAGLQ